MVALQNDRLRSMPASFLPPSPVNKPGTEVLLIGFWLEMAKKSTLSLLWHVCDMLCILESSQFSLVDTVCI